MVKIFERQVTAETATRNIPHIYVSCQDVLVENVAQGRQNTKDILNVCKE
jgi:hypothetical protein